MLTLPSQLIFLDFSSAKSRFFTTPNYTQNRTNGLVHRYSTLYVAGFLSRGPSPKRFSLSRNLVFTYRGIFITWELLNLQYFFLHALLVLLVPYCTVHICCLKQCTEFSVINTPKQASIYCIKYINRTVYVNTLPLYYTQVFVKSQRSQLRHTGNHKPRETMFIKLIKRTQFRLGT